MNDDIVLRTSEGKRVILNVHRDERLYKAPVNPPNTGTKYTSGSDLYLHIAQSGAQYYYLHEWSMWQGATDNFELIDEESALVFFEHAMGSGSSWVRPTQNEINRMNELGFQVDVETA